MRSFWSGFSTVAIAISIAMPPQIMASPAQRPTPYAGVTPSPAVVARAKEWFHRFVTGNIDRSQLSARLNAEFTDAKVRSESEKLKKLGEPKSFTFLRSYSLETTLAYHFLLQFDSERVVEVLAFGIDGKIEGIGFYEIPPGQPAT